MFWLTGVKAEDINLGFRSIGVIIDIDPLGLSTNGSAAEVIPTIGRLRLGEVDVVWVGWPGDVIGQDTVAQVN